MNNDHLNLLKLDTVFPHLHDAGKFDLRLCIPSGIEFKEPNGLGYPPISIISHLLTKYGYATVSDYPDYLAELTPKGQEAKKAGGHFAYLNKVSDKEHQEKESSKIDLLQKQFIYKARYTPYIFSTLALIGTVISLNISYKALYKSVQPLTPLTTDTTTQNQNEILLHRDTIWKIKDTLQHQ